MRFDPQRIALQRAGRAAQACYDQSQLKAGTAGKLVVRIALASDGHVERAEIDRAPSTPALLGGALEACVLDRLREQVFPPPRAGAEVVLEVPLQFRPTK